MTTGRIIANDVLLGQVCELIASGRQVKLPAKGDSMRPFIRGKEDIIVLSAADSLRVGDVVMARIRDGEYILHRIIHIDGDNIRLAGDANLYQTEDCLRKDICAVALSVVRKDREHSLTDFKAHATAKLWRLLLPLRRILQLTRCILN